MARTGEQTKQQIIEVATEFFGRYGFDKVTMKQVAKRLHISEPAVYKYFPSKESLSVAVLNSLAKQLQYDEVFEKLSRQSDVKLLLTDLAMHIITYFSRRHEIYRLLLFSALLRHSHAFRVYRNIRGTYTSFLCEQLDRLYAEKRIVKKHNNITARCFIGMVFDCAMAGTVWKGMQGEAYPVEVIVKNNVSIYARGLEM